MNGVFFALVALLSLNACNTIKISNKTQKEQERNNSVLPLNHNKISVKNPEVPIEAVTWDADLYLVNFNQEEETKVKNAVMIIKKVISSKEFKDRVLNFTYKGQRQFNDNQGLSNEEIYRKILEGAEKIGNSTRNNIMDVELELYHQLTKTIGYTYPNTVRIWMNKKYFDRYTPIEVADNLMHEWMHKLGFTHDISWSQDRDHTVPYAIGYLVEELAKKHSY